MLHNHESISFSSHSIFFFPSVRSSCGSRTWSGFTWICSAAAATWPVCRAANPPTPNAYWVLLRVPPSWPWDDWESSLFPPSTHWYYEKHSYIHSSSCRHVFNTDSLISAVPVPSCFFLPQEYMKLKPIPLVWLLEWVSCHTRCSHTENCM